MLPIPGDRPLTVGSRWWFKHGTRTGHATVTAVQHHLSPATLEQEPAAPAGPDILLEFTTTVQSIQRAVEEAELMAGVEINAVYAGIAGSHIRSLNSHGVVAIRDREVSQHDVDHVIEAAKAVAIPADQRILHVLPQEFVIDGQEGIRDPIGMSGVRLEAKVHIVTCADSAAHRAALPPPITSTSVCQWGRRFGRNGTRYRGVIVGKGNGAPRLT